MSDGGFLYPAIAVGRELSRRGFPVCLLGRSSAARVSAHARLPFLAAEDRGGQGGFSVARWVADGLPQYRAVLRAAREIRASVLVTSVLCHGALLAGEVLDLPVVVLGLAAHMWDYRAGGDDEPRTVTPRDWRTRETLRFYGELRRRAGLPARRHACAQDPLIGSALLLRGDPALEYPGAVLPSRVHHVGPCSWEPRPARDEVDAVLSHLDRVGKHVVYVHLGRTFGGESLWPRLNAAFSGSEFQAVVEQGRSRDPRPAPGADILLVRKPWLGPLMDRAGLVLTSATSAPVLAALLRGLPLTVSPAGSEQPALAAACVRAGVAVHVPAQVRGGPLTELRRAWRDREMRSRSRRIGDRLASMDSTSRAADAVQRVTAGDAAAISPA